MAWLAFASAARSYPSLDKPWLSLAAARLADGGQWLEFAANNVRLFNGITVIHYFSGARPWTLPYDAGAVLAAVLVLGGFVLAATRRRSWLDAALIAGCAGTWLLFYAFAGPQALRPHAERWGLCLLVPASLVLARGIGAWIEHVPRLRWASIGTASLAAAALLGSFYVNYFRAFATTGGRSHLTYVTAPIEPKQQALSRILGRGAGSTRVEIATRQWWLYWPIAYLATPHPTVSVRLDASSDAVARSRGAGSRHGSVLRRVRRHARAGGDAETRRGDRSKGDAHDDRRRGRTGPPGDRRSPGGKPVSYDSGHQPCRRTIRCAS